MSLTVIPEKAGIQFQRTSDWMPAAAGMTTCCTLVTGSLLMFASLTFRKNLLRLEPAPDSDPGARDFNHPRWRHYREGVRAGGREGQVWLSHDLACCSRFASRDGALCKASRRSPSATCIRRALPWRRIPSRAAYVGIALVVPNFILESIAK